MHACVHTFGELDGSRFKRSESGTTEPLSVVQDNVGPCKGTSVHPLCVREGEAKVES